MDEDLHRRRGQADAHTALVAPVDELDRLDLREVGIGDDHLVDTLGRENPVEVDQRSQRTQAVLGQRRRREKADDLDGRVLGVHQRVGDIADVLARPHEHCTPAVARGAQQRAGEPLVARPQHGDVEQREGERAVEEVVAGEVFAVDDREQERDECDLEQAADDSR